MFSIFKQNKKTQEIPEWASFFNQKEYNIFLKAVDNYLNKKDVSYELGDGLLIVGNNNFGFNNLGLTNVAQVCKQDKPSNYRKIVTEHFNSMIRAQQFETQFNKIIDDYNEVKEYIGVRLYPNDYISYIGKENTLGKAFAGDIYALLVFDLPDSIINIQPEQANNWDKTFDELFETGVQNIKQKYPLHITQEELSGFNIWFIESNQFFTPNIVLDLENQPQMIGSYGSLIAIPHRHSVIIYPIENIEVVNAINTLVYVVSGMYNEGPGSISNNLFWYNNGLFENLPYKIGENKLEFSPPDKFVHLLNKLKPKD